MKIGIDISQVVYEKTGVAKYVKNLVENLIKIDKKNEYILFFASLRRKTPIFNFQFSNKSQISNSKIQIRSFKIPPTLLDIIWNRIHILPIEWLIGPVNVFITSDWTEPPAKKAKKVTILYDLIVFRHPQETAKKIVEVQRRKLKWVKKESEMIICISEATKKDAMEILGIEEKRLKVIYPGGI